MLPGSCDVEAICIVRGQRDPAEDRGSIQLFGIDPIQAPLLSKSGFVVDHEGIEVINLHPFPAGPMRSVARGEVGATAKVPNI